MSIKFACPNCKKVLQAPDDKAGARLACPGCKKPLQVPAASKKAPAPRPVEVDDEDGAPPAKKGSSLPAPASDAGWYYTQEGEQVGPVSLGELKQLASDGDLQADDLVWQEGMPEWTAASSVKGIFGSLGSKKSTKSTTDKKKKSGRKGAVPRVSPVSAFGPFMCCIGGVWTIISYFQVCSGANKLDADHDLQGWTIFVPIYSALYMSTVAKALNETIDKNHLDVDPVMDNIILNFLFPYIPLYKMFTGYNEIADALEGKA